MSIVRTWVSGFSLFLCTLASGQKPAGAPQPPPDARETQEEIGLIESLLPRLADPAAAQFQLAHDYAHLGDAKKAMAFLVKSLAANEGFNPENDQDFRPLQNDPAFRALIDGVHQHYKPLHRARTAFTVAERALIPEGLTADPDNNLLYMGSLNRRKIVKIAHDGTVSDLFSVGKYSIKPICGLKFEKATNSIWAATCSDDGKGADLLHFGSSGDLLERYSPAGSGKHLLNDLVLRGSGEIYITDSLANRAYRFDRTSHTFSELPLCRAVYYPNGITLRDDGNMLYVADAFGIVELNLKTGSSRELQPGAANTVSGADGLYWYADGLIAIQNGLGEPRIARFHLSADGLRVLGTTVLEYRSSSVEEPTTGAILGAKFYFISNSQIGNFSNGEVKEPSRLENVRISVIDLDR